MAMIDISNEYNKIVFGMRISKNEFDNAMFNLIILKKMIKLILTNDKIKNIILNR